MGTKQQEYESKLLALSVARGETPEETSEKFDTISVLNAPSFSKHLSAVRMQNFSDLGTEEDLAWASLPDGHHFFSPQSHGSMQRQFDYVSDTLSPKITGKTLLAAIDVVQRYVTDAAWPSESIFPKTVHGLSVVELGAYLGHKTVRFAENVAASGGKVLAIEMMDDNYRILNMNIEANGLSDVVETRRVGVWDSSGLVSGVGKGRQRRSLLPLSQLTTGGESIEVNVETLTEILEHWTENSVDLVFATINGAEVEMLKGYSPDKIDVKSWFIAAPYRGNVDEHTSAEFCFDYLVELGYEPISRRGQNRIEMIRKSSAL